MPYAVIRVAKLKSAAQASAATAHNYREHPLRNADSQAPHPNREFVNHGRQDFGELAEARISQVVSRAVRADQVKAVEVVLTGSPEGFKRGPDGRAVDYSNSKWAADNLRFLQDKYGKENVVSFTLHQDEKTPHAHAVIVPLTADGRLSAKDLFNPQSLRALQSEYALAMREHGFERGVEHSQTQHQPPRRHYGQADQVGQLGPGPVGVQAVELGEIPLFGREEWKNAEQARVNAELSRQVGQAQERAQKAVGQAQANASAQEQVKTLRKQLATSEGLKQAHFAQLQTQQAERAEFRRLAVGVAQGDKPSIEGVLKQGQAIREAEKKALTGQLERILGGKVRDVGQFLSQLTQAGYRTHRVEQGTVLVHEQTGARFPTSELRPNGQAIGLQLTAAVERTQAQEREVKKGKSRGPSLG